VRVSAWFEVFDCGDAFDVILGKPWLQAVCASHDYDGDRIHIRTGDSEAVICNDEGETGVEEPETEEEIRERVWSESEAARLARKTAKEQGRKRAQLERRAEQPLPFPGLGYSPSAWTAPTLKTPRPCPTPKPEPSDGVHAIEDEASRE
jgi:hypothetical protein